MLRRMCMQHTGRVSAATSSLTLAVSMHAFLQSLSWLSFLDPVRHAGQEAVKLYTD